MSEQPEADRWAAIYGGPAVSGTAHIACIFDARKDDSEVPRGNFVLPWVGEPGLTRTK